MIVRKCSKGGAFEVIPENVTLDLGALGKKFPVKLSTKLLVILDLGYEVTCYRKGRLVIKGCPSEEVAEKIAKKVFSV